MPGGLRVLYTFSPHRIIHDAGNGLAHPAEQIHHRNEITEACRTQARYKLTVVVVVVVARQTC